MVLHQNVRQLENDAMERMQKEAVVVKATPQHFPGGSKDIQKKPHSR
jgi:hypothetical protein